MGRPRKNNKIVWEQSVKELLATHDINPLDELIKIAKELIEVRPDDDPSWIEPLLDDYELVRMEDKRYLRPKLKHRINVFSELAQYTAPKLRSTETKGAIDYNFHLTIKEFPAEETKRVDVMDVPAKLISE